MRENSTVVQVVFKVASLAIRDDPELQVAYTSLAEAINAELEEECKGFTVGVNEMEKLVTSVVAAKRECRLVDLLLSTKKHRPTASNVIEAMANA